jgi:hypothetical protein
MTWVTRITQFEDKMGFCKWIPYAIKQCYLLGIICSFFVDQTSIRKTLREEYGVNHEWQ